MWIYTFDVNYFFSISRIFVPPPRLQEADTNSQILLSLFWSSSNKVGCRTQCVMERAKYWYPRVWQRDMWQNIWLRVQQNICYESFCEQNICKSDSLCLSLLISVLTSTVDSLKRVWCKFSGCNLPPLAHDFFFFLFTNYPYFIYIFGKWMPFLGKNVFCRALPYQKNIFLKIISPNNRGCSVKTTVVCAELLKLLHTQCGCALSLLWVCWLDCCAADNTQPSPAKLNFSDKVTAATSNKCVN